MPQTSTEPVIAARRCRPLRDALLVLLCACGMGTVAVGMLFGRALPEPASNRVKAYARPSFRSTLDAVNQQFNVSWEQAGVESAAAADPLQVARRLSLALTGTVPSVEEIRWLQRLPKDQRVAYWTERLLDDRRTADYLAERLARAYVGTEDGPFLVYRRRRFVNWLSDALLQNRPYDRIVRDLVSDGGIWTDAPAVNFITATSDPQNDNKPDEARLAARVSRAMLGLRIDCLQCHDDRLGSIRLGAADALQDGMQSHFHQLAAYFSEADASLLGVRDRHRPYKFQYLDDSQQQVVDPQPPFLRDLLTGQGTRRQQLAAWITHPENKPFARATVNRIWALLFGRPLVEPIDSIPLEGDYPPGLETLAEDFAQQGYDLHRLIRLIAASDVFQRDSRGAFEVTPEHEARWAVFPLTRLRPEQVAGALLQASSLKTIDEQSHVFFRLARDAQENEFVSRYGDTGEDEFSDHGGTVTQRLLMMNGRLVREKIKANPLVNASTQIARYAPDAETAIETAYLAVLARQPSDDECNHFTTRMAAASSRISVADLQDLYWVLINSTEFSWNH